MSHDVAAELWYTIYGKNEIVAIAEMIAPFFKSRKKDEKGISSRYISVKDIEFEKLERTDEIEFQVRIEFLSDQGSWWQSVIVKEFRTDTRFQHEIDFYNSLERKCNKFDHIRPLPMIHIGRDKRRIIYEDFSTERIDQFSLLTSMKDYILGKLSAILQGNETYMLDENHVRSMVSYLIEIYPFTLQQKHSILNLLEPHYSSLQNCGGGYSPSTLFDESLFGFIRRVDEAEITKNLVNQHQAFTIYIYLLQPEEEIIDRMTDVSMHYLQETFDEFTQSGKVDASLTRIDNFFQGYHNSSTQVGIPSIDEMYPNGHTLDLQMFINFLLLEVSKLQKGMETGSEIQKKDKLRFMYYLLVKCPFNLIQATE